jgi:surfeit locus 1 family protein
VIDTSKKSLPSWLPFAAGALLVLQFAGLCAWQVSRGFEKLEARNAYDAGTGFSRFYDGADVRPYQPLRVSGVLDADHQFLLDNTILNSRIGYYVLTPLQLGDDEPLLLVNRGWIEKQGVTPDMAAVAETIAISDARVELRGRAGSLPRPGMRMGESILETDNWPQVAVYPTLDDLSRSLGREVQTFVLLLDPDERQGFVRHWVPEEMGPGKHFGYALQWFAMGAVLASLLIWHYRKRRTTDERPEQ